EIRTLGRVDHKDAFLDTFEMERQRGITIFSKQAVLKLPEIQITLLDTPGHVDFSAEMERTLDVLDAAILVINGSAGIQSHTVTVWKLLRKHNIPTFLFINKMDLAGADKSKILTELSKSFGDGFVDFSDMDYDTLAMYSESMMDMYLNEGYVSDKLIKAAVNSCTVFPCWFGSALKLEGVTEFLEGLQLYTAECKATDSFGAKVYKISRDDQNYRLTHLKVTGGILKVKDVINGSDWSEKVNQIRVYSGNKFTPVNEAYPGDIVAVTGLTKTAPGQGLGTEAESVAPSLEPVLNYRVILPSGYDSNKALMQFKQLEEEEPQLHVHWDARLQEISVRLMGPIQLDILKSQFRERFDIDIDFDQGSIIYRETIANTVEGVGHYEPLRHYSEVHLILEPAERGSGIHITTTCSEDELDRNWQRLILTHLAEKVHLGVLTGSPITDITITLAAGKAHLKHTEGGDFRQSTYRAVRQGLMQAESILLEPWYEFRLEIPQGNVGRAMSDLQLLGAEYEMPESDGEFAVLTGKAPVSAMQNYPQEVVAYTRGLGRFSCSLAGYAPCKNQDEIVASFGYDPEADVENTPDSVFCSHGAGYNVKWNKVFDNMHLPSVLKEEEPEEEPQILARRYAERLASDSELMAIFERTYGPVKTDRYYAMQSVPKKTDSSKPYKAPPKKAGPEYLLVDGYNIIFAWDDLKKLSEESLDLARSQLINRLRNYQGYIQSPVIIVFDAYKVKDGLGSIEQYGGLSVVYTKEAETADMYIEKTTNTLAKQYKVRVATSDTLEQVIILGSGARRISALAFQDEVKNVEKTIQDFLRK
ncbi:MAG: NYN domain-containing protein, partial [Oscillospiraceae bacterium]|nr:NYN domain-containing protein [Oscillospiraceae bacterium]